MERDRGFNFKLSVPPRLNIGEVSAFRPQEIVDTCKEFNKLHKGFRKSFGEDQNLFPHTSVVAPTKPNGQAFPRMKVRPIEKEEKSCTPGQLYSKLFDEVEKIQCWKVKVDSDTLQNESKLQENKRIIDCQRKAIQELQIGNESLSMKLEEQISENEILRNRNNATWNLCSVLKDTFQRSTDKMHLFESEREETHHLLTETSESIQKLIAVFESLRIQAEADQQEMQKVKEGLLQFENLKEKYHQEYGMKVEEVAMLQTKLREKGDVLQKLLLDLHESQDQCRQLQEKTNQQCELLKSSNTEQESLLHKLISAEKRCKDAETNKEATAVMLKKSKEEYAQIIQSKDLSLQELHRLNNQQAEKLEQIQATIGELQNSLALAAERAKENENILIAKNEELESRNKVLEETIKQSIHKDGQIRTLEDELDKKSKSMESMEFRLGVVEVRREELKSELVKKNKEAQLFMNKVQEMEEQLLNETKKTEEYIFQLDKDLAQHKLKYEELLSNFNKVLNERNTIEQLLETGSSDMKAMESNMKVSEEKVVKFTREVQRLQEENQGLQDELNSIKTKMQGKHKEAETLQKKIEKTFEHLQEEITKKENHIKAVEAKVCNLRKNETNMKAKAAYQKENKMLKKQIAKEIGNSNKLENAISNLNEESKNLRRLNEENQQKLLQDLESKASFVAQLQNEVHKLRMTADEAIKSKEDTELKCQYKTADMVALMEKHKSQYDRMMEEKDAELDEKSRREMEAVTCQQSMEVAMSKQKSENDELKTQLKAEMTEKENLQKELANLKRDISSMKSIDLSEEPNSQSSALNHKEGNCWEAATKSFQKRHVFEFPKAYKQSRDDKSPTVKKSEIQKVNLTPRGGTTSRDSGTSKIKSYRVKTPPSAQTACWEKEAFAFEPVSDSSEQNNLFTFVNTPATSFPGTHSNLNCSRKIRSPVNLKSPGNSLKLAAVKRMRDAGWTAVIRCDKKKKTNEKIFA